MTDQKHNTTGVAEWVALHWLEYWYSARHTGARGHDAEQARRHARYWLSVNRQIRAGAPGPIPCEVPA